jgi:hypothetical protein
MYQVRTHRLPPHFGSILGSKQCAKGIWRISHREESIQQEGDTRSKRTRLGYDVLIDAQAVEMLISSLNPHGMEK